MLDSIWHMTLKLFCNRVFVPNVSDVVYERLSM